MPLRGVRSPRLVCAVGSPLEKVVNPHIARRLGLVKFDLRGAIKLFRLLRRRGVCSLRTIAQMAGFVTLIHQTCVANPTTQEAVWTERPLSIRRLQSIKYSKEPWMFFCVCPKTAPRRGAPLPERLSPSDNTQCKHFVVGSRLRGGGDLRGNTKSINLCDKQSSRRPKDLSTSSSFAGWFERRRDPGVALSLSELSDGRRKKRPRDDK